MNDLRKKTQFSLDCCWNGVIIKEVRQIEVNSSLYLEPREG